MGDQTGGEAKAPQGNDVSRVESEAKPDCEIKGTGCQGTREVGTCASCGVRSCWNCYCEHPCYIIAIRYTH